MAKLSPDGSKLLWIAKIGGSATDIPIGLVVDSSDNIYFSGKTGSLDFPTTPGAWDRTHNGGLPGDKHGSLDAFAVKLSADGQTLLYSTFLGGNHGEDSRGGLAVDDQGCAYVTITTRSTDFLDEGGVPNPAKVNSMTGNQDGALVKLSADGSSIVYCRYIGGSVTDVPVGACVDSQHNAYVHVLSRSPDMATTPGAFQNHNAGGPGGADSYFAKISPDGKSLIYATYCGGSGNEYAEHRMALDSSGNAYFSGCTCSSASDFPTVNAHQRLFGGGTSDGYLVRLDPRGHPVFSTYFGGSGSEVCMGGPAVDGSGHVLVASGTASSNCELTPGAYQRVVNGGREAYFAMYDASGTLAYATYFGGSNNDQGMYVTLDGSGNAIHVGLTLSADLPTTAGAYDRTYGGGEDVFVAKFKVSWTQTPGTVLSVQGK